VHYGVAVLLDDHVYDHVRQSGIARRAFHSRDQIPDRLIFRRSLAHRGMTMPRQGGTAPQFPRWFLKEAGLRR
jgi:hypothetical protein